MRIGVLTNFADRGDAGIGRYQHNLAKALLKVDTENEYVFIHTPDRTLPIYNNTSQVCLPFLSSNPWKLISGAITYPWILHKYKLDILHDTGQIAPFYFPSSKKRILTLLDVTPYTHPQYHPRLSQTYHQLLLKRSVKNASHCITISQSTKQDALREFDLPEDHFSAIHLAADRAFSEKPKKEVRLFREERNLPENFVLHVGTIEPRKNIPALLHAIHTLRSEIDNLHCVLVGSRGWGWNPVASLIKELGLHDIVHVIGKVPEQELPLWYNAASVMCYPSWYEGFGFPILEAMACGCPVITSNTSSLPEVAGDAARFINPADTSTIAQALSEVLSSSRERQRLRTAGFLQNKKFSWIATAKKTKEVYEKI